MPEPRASAPPSDVLQIVYDGECPFCSNFVELYRIRATVGSVELVDARERPDLVSDFSRRGLEINDGMIALWQGQTYYGADSVTLLSMLSSEKGAFAALNRLLFRNHKVAGFIYPLMVWGRKLALRLLGRRLIEVNG